MILVLGVIDEQVTAWFLGHLSALGRDFVFVDERQLGGEVHLELDWEPERGRLLGELRFPRWRVGLEEVSGVYSRLGTGGVTPPDTPEARAGRAHAAALLDLFSGPVANRASAMLSNGSKPCQYAAILAAGLRVPDTFAGGRWEQVRRFADGLDGLPVIKSISDERSLVKQVSLEALQAAAPPGQPLPPHQLQQRAAGTNIRAHVVGGRQVLACRAVTEALDYRHPDLTGHSVELEPVELPEAVAEACRRLSRSLDLGFAGIDLIEPPGGSPHPADWWCLEVNTCPGYLWFEQRTGLPISRVLADFLMGLQ